MGRDAIRRDGKAVLLLARKEEERGVTVMYGRERKREKDDEDHHHPSKSGYRNRELHLQREDHSFTQTDTCDVNAYLSLLVRGEREDCGCRTDEMK